MSAVPMRRLGEALSLEDAQVAVDPAQVYPLAGVYSFGRGLMDRGSLGGDETRYQKLNRLSAGQVVFAKLNAWEGAIAIVPPEFDGYHLSPEFPILRPDPDTCDLRYLHHLFRWPELWERMAPRGSMIRRKRTTPATFLALDVPLPSLDEQRRIASLLDSLQSITTAVTSSGQKTADTAVSIVDRVLASDWPRQPIGNVATRVRRALAVESDTLYPLLGVRWYGGGCFLREQRRGAELSADVLYRVERGDFIYNRLFGWKGSFAVVGPEHHDAAVSVEFPIYRGNDGVLLTEYLGVVCAAPGFMDMAYGRSRGATATSRNRLREAEFEQIEIPVPPVPLQRKIVKVADQVAAYRRLTRRRDALAEALGSSMLSAALTGKL